MPYTAAVRRVDSKRTMNDDKARGYKYVMKPEALINVHYKKTTTEQRDRYAWNACSSFPDDFKTIIFLHQLSNATSRFSALSTSTQVLYKMCYVQAYRYYCTVMTELTVVLRGQNRERFADQVHAFLDVSVAKPSTGASTRHR